MYASYGTGRAGIARLQRDVFIEPARSAKDCDSTRIAMCSKYMVIPIRRF
jgi:hypothetical protein